MENAQTFGQQAKAYFAARPAYPDDLFEWISSKAPHHQRAWDVGTGSGQAAARLVEHFDHVHATDIDPEQIRQAPVHPQITFRAAAAHMSGLPSQSVGAITVATALHWFDHAAFWGEVRRVACPGAIFCGWTYHRPETDADVRHVLLDPVAEVLAPYWSDGNRLSWRGYAAEELRMPFEVIAAPEFACRLRWTPAQIVGFVRSWSAFQKSKTDGHAERLASIERHAVTDLGDAARRFELPLHMIAAGVA